MRQLCYKRAVVRPVDTLLVVAHPDDETLYFGPWLLSGLAPNCDVLVVTDGNHAGRGEQRQQALRLACEDLGVRSVQQWDFLDHPGFCLDLKALQSRLRDLQAQKGYAQVLTHSPHGEYGHLNHVDVSLAVHRVFEGQAEVWVPADKLYPQAQIELNPEQFARWTRILLERYPKEFREAFRDIRLPRTSGALRVRLDEVQAMHALITEGETPGLDRLEAYAHLSDVLECLSSAPKTR